MIEKLRNYHIDLGINKQDSVIHDKIYRDYCC